MVRRRIRPTAALALCAAAAFVAIAVPSAATAGGGRSGGGAPGADPGNTKVVTVAGSLQDELGCAADWDPVCAATILQPTWTPGVYRSTFHVPVGAFEMKVTIGQSWTENYGAGGVPDGANIPLAVPAEVGETLPLVFTYDDTTHLLTIAPTDLPPPWAPERPTQTDRRLADGSLRTLLTREQFYFVMTDRFANGDPTNDLGGYTGDRLSTGFDPTDKGFYHGGDLRGLIDQLDYIQALGTTSIWLTPSFANKPVQGAPGDESAGYHGYWITDFTQIDPHLGTNDELKELIDTAHGKGMKVFFDIITNHTADVIDYAEGQYTYISKDTSPYVDADGNVFDDRDYVNSPDFPAMTTEGFPYTPVFTTPEDATAKTPSWLNNPLLYHNRGDSTFAGESAEYGDFVGLDDLFTEHPLVEQGMEDIYRAWVDFGIDGFRIDTVKHVNLEFWQEFSPAMLEEAQVVGTDDFFMFGEVFDANPAFQSTYTTAGKLPATLDFGFQSAAVAVTNGKPTTTLADMFAGDDYYTDTDSNAYNLPTFLGNHDMGRIGRFVGGDLQKDLFANALMFTLRGQPVIYYGDEQGFTGDGGDKDARHDMFASQVASYNDDAVIGGTPGSADRFGTDGPVFTALAELSALRRDHPALADGAQIPRYASSDEGIFAVSRVDADEQVEYLVVANNAATAETATFDTFTTKGGFAALYGGGAPLAPAAEGQVTVTVPPLTVQVYRAERRIQPGHGAPRPTFVSPAPGGVVAARAEIRAMVPGDQYAEVTYAFRPAGTSEWQPLGTDDNAPFRVFHDVSGYAKGTLLEYRAIVEDNNDHLAIDTTYGVVGDPPPPPTSGGGVGDVEQPGFVSVPGTANTEMGCAADWAPDCPQAQLTLDANDEIWKGTFTLPAGPYAYKAAIDQTWDENYGAGAVRDGANIEFTSDGVTPITFFYDHRTHYVTSTAQALPSQALVVTAAGSFQSEMGCPADWAPECMRSWLQDPDGDGIASLATVQVPAGTYEVKATVGRSWDENYGDGGVPNGNNIPFTVPADGLVTTFAFDTTTHVLTVSVAAAKPPPDLGVADARWVDGRTIAYPLDRLPAGVDPRALRYRLHWGDLAVDATSLGGTSAALDPSLWWFGLPPDHVALRLDRATARRIDEIRAAPLVAVGVYDDAGRLLDATSVAGPVP
jgi:glycosidase